MRRKENFKSKIIKTYNKHSKLYKEKILNSYNNIKEKIIDNKFKIVFIIAVISILIYLLLKLTFFISEPLKVSLSPNTIDERILTGSSKNIDFEIDISNFPTCNTICTFTLFDINYNSILSNSTLTFNKRKTLNQSIDFKSPDSGEGILNYRYKVSCKNTETFFCPASEESHMDESFITIKYNLGEEDLQIKEKAYNTLISEINNFNLNNNLIKSSLLSLNNFEECIPNEIIIKKNETNKIKSVFNLEIEKMKKYLSLWDLRKYSELSSLEFNETLSLSIQKNSNDVNYLIEMYNKIIELDNINKSQLFEYYNFSYLLSEKRKNTSDLILFSDFIKLTTKINNSIQCPELIEKRHNEIENIASEYEDIKNILNLEKTKLENQLDYQLFVLNLQLNDFLSNYSLENLEKYYQKSDNYCNSLLYVENKINQHNLNISNSLYQSNISNINIAELSLYNKIKIKVLNELNVSIINSTIKLSIPNITLLYDQLIYFNQSSNLSNQTNNITNQKNNISIQEKSFLFNLSKYNTYSKINISNDFKKLKEISCSNISIFPNMQDSSLNMINYTYIEYDLDLNIKNNSPTCCFYGNCSECKDNEKNYPIVFIHGHLFSEGKSPSASLNSFSKIMTVLEKNGFIDTGDYQLSSDLDIANSWGFNQPVGARVSYYYITYVDLGIKLIQVQKSERIENYALRLNEFIKDIKLRTGKEKVNIVAYSMGGLVAREYLSIFGENNVDNLITIGTPHFGVTGKVKTFCSISGASKECEDMSAGSLFLQKLNSPKNIPTLTKITTIGGTECIMGDNNKGDGVVLYNHSILPYAKIYNVTYQCNSLIGEFHSKLLDPEIFPQVPVIINNTLKG